MDPCTLHSLVISHFPPSEAACLIEWQKGLQKAHSQSQMRVHLFQGFNKIFQQSVHVLNQHPIWCCFLLSRIHVSKTQEVESERCCFCLLFPYLYALLTLKSQIQRKVCFPQETKQQFPQMDVKTVTQSHWAPTAYEST